MSQFLNPARFVRTSTPKCREIVLEILRSSQPTPLSSQVIYQRVRDEYPDEKVPLPQPLIPRPVSVVTSRTNPMSQIPLPPHPDHPIRSVRYLKTVVLQDLVARGQVQKVHSMREPTAEELQRAKGRSRKRSKKNKDPHAAPVIINVKGMIDQWAWALKTSDSKEEDEKEKERIQKAMEGQRDLDTKRLEKQKKNEFIEKWGHLNPRRQRARVGKLEREEKWAKMLEHGRQEGMAAAQRASS